jgi:outer membrane protein, heavy metal efflux system
MVAVTTSTTEMLRRSVLALVLATGCAPSQAQLRRPVDAEIMRRLDAKVDVLAPPTIDALLAKPLERDTAVRIALANSPRLRASMAELGVAGGELATALGLGPLSITGTLRFLGENEIDVMQSIEGLLLAPRRRAAARAGLDAARAEATATALRLVARVEIAFQDLLAAQQESELRRTAFDAADAAAVIRERMHAAGNTTDLALARDRDAREQARVDVSRAEANVEIAREHINALLGLTGTQTSWRANGQLGELPAAPPALDDLETAAVGASLDLAAGLARVDAAANTAGAERVRAFLPELGVGWSIQEHDGAWRSGPAVSIGVPLFDQRSGMRARARAELARADAVLDATAVELRAGARAARVAALAAYHQARHIRTTILPLRQQIVDETLLQYNAMNADSFQLIVARRQLVEAGQQYLDALRRYWNAMSEVTALRRGVHLEMTASMPASSSSGATTDDRHP